MVNWRTQSCINIWYLPSDAREQRNKNFSKKYWNVYCELVLKLISKDNCCLFFCFFLFCFFFFTSVWMLTSLYHVLFCTLTFTYSCCFLLMNFRQVCTCPWGRYIKMNKCWWWHALQNVSKKNKIHAHFVSNSSVCVWFFFKCHLSVSVSVNQPFWSKLTYLQNWPL